MLLGWTLVGVGGRTYPAITTSLLDQRWKKLERENGGRRIPDASSKVCNEEDDHQARAYRLATFI